MKANDLLKYLEFYKDKNNIPSYKLYEIILVLSVTTLFLANVFAKKIITLLGFNIALSGLIFPFTFLFLILINESYGHQYCSKAIAALLIGQILFLFLIWRLPYLQPNIHVSRKETHINHALLFAFGAYGQVILGSMLGVGISYYFFSCLNSWLKVFLCSLHPFYRWMLSVGTAKFILVLIAYSFNLWGLMSIEQLAKLELSTWVIKMVLATIIIFISIPLVKGIKILEKSDIFDINVSFSPFSIFSEKSKGKNLFEKTKGGALK